MKYIILAIVRWILYFIPSFVIEFICYFLAPFVALFITQETRTDRVKRLGNQQVTMLRDYLVKPLYYFQTHDNAVDEWWYGAYNESWWNQDWTQATYDSSRIMRWFCRVMWLWRNCGYGFLYNWLSVPVEPLVKVCEKGTEQSFWYRLEKYENSFKLELTIPIFSHYYSMNIGWKEHKGFPRKLYANRIISFRTKE